VRIPAALCGAVGFRPTHDRYSRDGVLSLSSTLDAVSIISRTVADAAFLDGVLTSRASESPALSTEGLKVAYVRSSACSAAIRGYIDAAIERISVSGVTVVEVDLNEVYSSLPGATGSLETTVDGAVAAIRSFEAIREYAAYASTHNAPLPKKPKTSEEEEEPEEDGEAVKPAVTSQPLDTLVPYTAVVKACHLSAEEQAPLATAGRATAARYRQALLEERVRVQNTLSTALQTTGAQFLVYPTVPTATTHLKGAASDSIEIDGVTSPVNAALSINTKFASLAGAPAISVPCALTKPNPLAVQGSVDTERLPVALEIVGAIGDDEKVLTFGKFFQGLQSLLQDPIVVRRWNEAVTI
jgi:Asp-tRNA(Asn)/Glu-tRNA(Gln) amidotransferase A subunit family amidase